MRSYTPEYSQAAIDALLLASKRRRARAAIAIEQLCRGVPREGDFKVRDDAGRLWTVKLFDDVVLTYWVDHAVWEVRIGLIEWVD
jgi:hypothetical protein